jgi:hypothetical protein
MPKSVPFEQVLSQYLQDPERAMSYLQNALAEDDPILFQAALQDVIDVRQTTIDMTSTLPKLVDSLKRHGVAASVIQAVVSEITIGADAA